jgi:hypothetical protein
MNPRYEKQLEASVRRELETLGELPAPPALANRILLVIKQRAALPWYRQAWTAWPLALRAVTLVLLVGVVGGSIFGVWEWIGKGAMQAAMQGWFGDLCALWRTAGVLVDVAGTSIGSLGTKILGAGFALMFVACVACISLTLACVRLAVRPVTNRI